MAEKSKSKEPQTSENIIVAADHGRLDLVTALLEGGADPNTVDEIGTSPLHNAAKGGHWHIARLLLEKNASPRIEDGNRATPLRLAVKAGHQEIVRLLLECDPLISETKERETYRLLRIAAALGYTEIVQLFLDCNTPTLGSNGEETALHLAAAKGHHVVCELLLNHDKALTRSLWDRMTGPSLEVYSKDYVGNTPFAYAVEKGHERTVEVFLRSYPEMIFLNHGTDIELKDKQGRRALHVAISAENMGYVTGATEIIKLLLEHGASVDAKDKDGHNTEYYSNNPKTRMMLRNHAATQSKGISLPIAPISSAPPPEYKA
ncbi:hypothetical protein N7516_008953 [Penicillium verrucosum]|uniref:uncharacterized protein n=1 Tax=Penicillium verrucosum TaxID=60171 RepID=UPI002545AC2E|nr:uncharacterized protein N7516_008953 [Penicillium verrucosum]KAJ5927180.1 hypothetical protein N7516_008953 [Penicillium verrucosum]